MKLFGTSRVAKRAHPARRRSSRTYCLETLERRLLFSADLFAVAALEDVEGQDLADERLDAAIVLDEGTETAIGLAERDLRVVVDSRHAAADVDARDPDSERAQPIREAERDDATPAADDSAPIVIEVGEADLDLGAQTGDGTDTASLLLLDGGDDLLGLFGPAQTAAPSAGDQALVVLEVLSADLSSSPADLALDELIHLPLVTDSSAADDLGAASDSSPLVLELTDGEATHTLGHWSLERDLTLRSTLGSIAQIDPLGGSAWAS